MRFVGGLLALVLALAVVAPPSAAAAPSITVGTHNSHYGDGSFERFAGVIGWQEVNDPVDREKLNRRLGTEYRTFYPPDGPAKAVPISWRKGRFVKVGSGSVRTHGGEAGVTPARYVNWVVLDIVGTGRSVIVVNTHFISGAWSRHPERQARWLKHYDVLYDTVARLRRNHPGKALFVVGDFNRHKAMPMPRPVKYVPVSGAAGVPIDHIYAPTTTTHGKVNRLPRWGSDHHAYRLYVTL